MTPRLRLEPRPMHESLAHRSQRHVEPLLRPAPIRTRVVTANVYVHPAIRWEPEVPPSVPRVLPDPPVKGIGPHPAKLPDGHPRKRIWLAKLRDRAREAGQDPEVSAKRSASLRRQWAEGKRHPRYQSPELTFGGQA